MNNYINKEVVKALEKREVKASYILAQIKKELVEAVMVSTRYNQSKSALLLNVSRGTFRTMLVELFGDKYIEKRGK